MTERPSDETLMAFADNALPDDDRSRTATYLQLDAEARAIVESFKRDRSLLRKAFNQPFSELAPVALVDAISGRSQSRKRKLPPQQPVRLTPYALPIAACFVAAVGLVASVRYLANVGPDDSGQVMALGPVSAGTPLSQLLTERPSGSSIAVASAKENAASRIAIVATFRDRADRACREIEEFAGENDASLPVSAGVACRQPNGSWVVEGTVRLAEAGDGSPGYVPSGATEQDALAGLLGMLGAKTSLTPAEEKALIDGAWK